MCRSVSSREVFNLEKCFLLRSVTRLVKSEACFMSNRGVSNRISQCHKCLPVQVFDAMMDNSLSSREVFNAEKHFLSRRISSREVFNVERSV